MAFRLQTHGQVRQRRPRLKDEKHLDFIRSLPCAVCHDNTATEAAHLRMASIEYDKRECGKAEKPNDHWVTPLCGRCHRSQHEHREETWWSIQGIDPFKLCSALCGVSGSYEKGLEIVLNAREET